MLKKRGFLWRYIHIFSWMLLMLWGDFLGDHWTLVAQSSCYFQRNEQQDFEQEQPQLLRQTSFTIAVINRCGNYQNSSLQQKVDDENSLGIIDFSLTRSISEDLARTGSETVFAGMLTEFPPGSSKQVSQQIRSSSAVIPLFSSLLIPCYRVEDTTTHKLTLDWCPILCPQQ